MRRKKRVFKPRGLRARFAVSFVVSALICGILFFVLYSASDYFLSGYFERSDFLESHIQKQGESLQAYIRENNISSRDLQKLKKWEQKQPVVLLELYSGETCFYSSFYEIPENGFRNSAAAEVDNHTVPIVLSDISASAVLYSDFTYQYYATWTTVAVLLSLVLFILLFIRRNRKLIRYICRLNEEVQILEGGNLEYQVSVEGNDELTDLARSMNRMRESFRQQMESEQALHQANRRLVTQMSHDLRTPLTGMMLYLEILRSRNYKTDEQLQDYLEKLDAKAHHLKQLSDHLFAYSFAETEKESTAPQMMHDAFGDIISQFTDDLSAQGFRVLSEVVWMPCFVRVNDEFIRRIFENIASNAAKYADRKETITISTVDSDKYCGFSVMNTCADSDRPIESSGVGIESIRAMMRQMNGLCTVEQSETIFEITLYFPKQN